MVQLAYSAERAAAFAYQGHASSLRNPAEKLRVQKIEREEWEHRDNLLRMMNTLAINPSGWLEMKYLGIGKLISALCHVLGYFMPMYFAGRLESRNVNEYLHMAEWAPGTILENEHGCIMDMARVEKEHEMYFLSCVERHWLMPLFRTLFRWGPGVSFNVLAVPDESSS